jgi:hypothetical protein
MFSIGDAGGMSQPDERMKFGYLLHLFSTLSVAVRTDSGVPLRN